MLERSSYSVAVLTRISSALTPSTPASAALGSASSRDPPARLLRSSWDHHLWSAMTCVSCVVHLWRDTDASPARRGRTAVARRSGWKNVLPHRRMFPRRQGGRRPPSLGTCAAGPAGRRHGSGHVRVGTPSRHPGCGALCPDIDRRSGTESLQPLRWRGLDSNHRFRESRRCMDAPRWPVAGRAMPSWRVVPAELHYDADSDDVAR
jgi:hypothetical protein